MPLEHRRTRAERRQHRVGVAGAGELEVVPADLRRVVAAHVRPEDVRQQLGAEADPEHRLVLLQRRFDHAQLGPQVRALRVVADVHRPAEHDESAVAVDRRPGVRVALEIHEADAMAAAPDQRIERSERFGGDVLEDEQAGHRWRAWTGTGPSGHRTRARRSSTGGIRRGPACRPCVTPAKWRSRIRRRNGMRARLVAMTMAAVAATTLPGAAAARVVDSAPGGFTVENAVVVPVNRAQAWQGLFAVGQWWPADHTWWGDASKLAIEPR